MRIRFSDGRPDDDQITDLQEARDVLSQLWPSCVIGDEEHGRRLVWRTEREADNDDGSNAAAEILIDE